MILKENKRMCCDINSTIIIVYDEAGCFDNEAIVEREKELIKKLQMKYKK